MKEAGDALNATPPKAQQELEGLKKELQDSIQKAINKNVDPSVIVRARDQINALDAKIGSFVPPVEAAPEAPKTNNDKYKDQIKLLEKFFTDYQKPRNGYLDAIWDLTGVDVASRELIALSELIAASGQPLNNGKEKYGNGVPIPADRTLGSQNRSTMKNSIRTIQSQLGVTVDGDFGPKTLKAWKKSNDFGGKKQETSKK